MALCSTLTAGATIPVACSLFLSLKVLSLLTYYSSVNCCTDVVFGKNVISIGTDVPFVGIGQLGARSLLDVAGGIRASVGAPPNNGYSFGDFGETGLVCMMSRITSFLIFLNVCLSPPS